MKLPDGAVLAWGENGGGRTGLGTTEGYQPTVARVLGLGGAGLLGRITTAAAGYNHSLALDADGTVWAWGANGRSQLGDGTTVNRKTPGQVLSPDGSGVLSNIVAVSAGNYFSMALDASGGVWAWGYGADGRLGDGEAARRPLPVRVHGVDGVGFPTPGRSPFSAGCPRTAPPTRMPTGSPTPRNGPSAPILWMRTPMVTGPPTARRFRPEPTLLTPAPFPFPPERSPARFRTAGRRPAPCTSWS